jgi:hypothetical protein
MAVDVENTPCSEVVGRYKYRVHVSVENKHRFLQINIICIDMHTIFNEAVV